MILKYELDQPHIEESQIAGASTISCLWGCHSFEARHRPDAPEV